MWRDRAGFNGHKSRCAGFRHVTDIPSVSKGPIQKEGGGKRNRLGFLHPYSDTLGGVSARSDGNLVSISIGFGFNLETDVATGNS